MNLTLHPLTMERWRDFEQLFGANGACGGCWCMSWRMRRKDFEANQGEPNKQAMQSLVADGEVTGLLAYDGVQPVAWISVAPREDFPRLVASRNLKLVDDKPVWSVVCFFVAKPYRKQGVTVALLNGAAQYVKEQGGQIMEGYPSIPGQQLPAPFLFTGVYSAFLQAGFEEVARPARTRAIVRRYI
jgi:GNAT superfamily N-acetyltransferase